MKNKRHTTEDTFYKLLAVLFIVMVAVIVMVVVVVVAVVFFSFLSFGATLFSAPEEIKVKLLLSGRPIVLWFNAIIPA